MDGRVLLHQRDVVRFRHLPINVRWSGKGNKNFRDSVAADVSRLISKMERTDGRCYGLLAESMQ